MNLAIQLHRQIDDPRLTFIERAQLRCRLAKELEDGGNYEAARSAMGELWQRIGEPPRLINLDQRTAAEVLLRAGSLTGWLGSAQQIDGAQEIAKDLISQSITNFKALKETEKVADAYIDLAICYWRESSFDEARITLREALGLVTDGHNEQKARALLNSAVIEISLNRFNDALHILKTAAPLFDEIQSSAAKGRFHNQYALVFKKLAAIERREDYIDSALLEYAAASYHFEKAGHTRYLARVENNLGFLLFITGKLAEAHEHLDRAQRLFSGLKDSGSTAQVNETRARVFLAQGRIAEAERVVRAAVRTLEKGDEASLLAEALTTHGAALARLGRVKEARAALGRAIEVAERVGDKESAGVAVITVIEELGAELAVDEMRAMYGRADQLLVNSQNVETLGRLRCCARRVLSAERVSVKEAAAPNFVYADENTAELLRIAHLVAGTDSVVLITGETGVGKEALARLIHQWSGRAGQFVAVNCGALTEALFESLLFGHPQGDFTDTVRHHAGAAREAIGGTLFLDGIGELSVGSQGKLLRFIERGEIQSTGVPERVDVRVVAATNHDLEQLVSRKEFRDDLFYRLNAFHLVVPPLRDRPDDVPPLAAHFIEELLKLHRKQVTFPPETIEAMRKLPLKGNARELHALIERSLLTAKDGEVITPSSVEALVTRQLAGAATLTDPWQGCSLDDEVLYFESNIVRLALETAKGSVTRAARLLGITHQRLCAMLQGRHKSLLPAKKVAYPHKRSIITK